MVPGLGLYLKEIFFERYHVKLAVEDEKKELAKQKLLAKGKPVPQETEPNQVIICAIFESLWKLIFALDIYLICVVVA